MTLAAVLTGDLIGSTHAGSTSVDRAMACLEQAAIQISGWQGASARFTRYRGDGWQMLLTNPAFVLRASLLVTAMLRGSGLNLATRISIGIGAVERSGGADLSDATGEAFVLSGRGLDRMAKSRRLVIAAQNETTLWQTAVLDLVERQTDRWSREQAQAAALSLDPAPLPHWALAERLGVSRQAFQARLKGSGLPAMAAALAAFEHPATGVAP